MFCKIDFACDDNGDVQKTLNYLYGYRDDIITKVLHRNRINLFCYILRDLIKHNNIPSFHSALDVGCNAGAYSKIISDFGFKHVLGIDIDGEAINKARQCFGFQEGEKILEYKVLDGEKIMNHEKCDLVLATEVIEHAEHPEILIQNIKDILKPGGVCIISLPNRISFQYLYLIFAYKITNNRMNEDLSRHLRYPFYRSINLFHENNLQVIRTAGSNLLLSSLILYLYTNKSTFTPINKINFILSRSWPFKYISQFFFLVLKKNP